MDVGEDSKEGVMVDSVESFLEVKEEQEVEAILLALWQSRRCC